MSLDASQIYVTYELGFLGWLAIGTAAGWFTTTLVRDEENTLGAHLIAGVVGALLGGVVACSAAALTMSPRWFVASFGTALFGAVLFILTLRGVGGQTRRRSVT